MIESDSSYWPYVKMATKVQFVKMPRLPTEPTFITINLFYIVCFTSPQ